MPKRKFAFHLIACLAWFACACFALKAATAGEAPVVLRIAGKAEVMRAGEWNVAKVGERITAGQAVRVSEGGNVTVSASDGKVTVTAKNGSVIRYDGVVNSASAPWKSSRLAGSGDAEDAASSENPTPQFSSETGEVEANVTPGSALRVVTPLITASVRGTRFTVRVYQDGSSALWVTEGAVEATSRIGEQRLITAGNSMSTTSAQFIAFLLKHGVVIEPGGDWRQYDPELLESIDDSWIKPGDGAGLEYYHPLIDRPIRDFTIFGVDKEKVAKATYLNGRDLGALLLQGDINPLAFDWLRELENSPLTADEIAYQNREYGTNAGRDSTSTSGPGGSGGGSFNDDGGQSFLPGERPLSTLLPNNYPNLQPGGIGPAPTPPGPPPAPPPGPPPAPRPMPPTAPYPPLMPLW